MMKKIGRVIGSYFKWLVFAGMMSFVVTLMAGSLVSVEVASALNENMMAYVPLVGVVVDVIKRSATRHKKDREAEKQLAVQ